ncbi:phosphomannomutase/phosphoglucomutase [Alkalilimnicola ehrlichii MLHE-1]|uniref:phosphomannomutase n=1 Tax=Alkalilimnicola ehrlichii (strain ATCC BAA-1101 / DSM 17681 / MLHE-1) TaxID=187272 RepID=Q0A4Q2_ALKEH|nr:phosphomannomutase/phosphoglucomutase [Alkalilimnicola ehrlichii]ABI58185.1 phosphomannomutase [Alkalilimnicola ehrlichii MLHE-1]
MSEKKDQAPGLPDSIFRTYDIRGIVTQGFNADVARLLGRAIGSEAADQGQRRVIVARDGRHSSPELVAGLTEGLQQVGRDVIDLGCVPTPLMYFATHHLGTGAGVMVTGSHNPPEYNGMKIMAGGRTLSGDDIQDLRRRVHEGDYARADAPGTRETYDIVPDYLARVTGDVRPDRPLKVVLDAGNGVAGAVAPALFRALGCEVEALYCEVDGSFPNHHPDPAEPKNVAELIDRVRAGGADVGLAFDGDGDRLGVVDNEGRIIWPDRQLMLYAQDVLSRRPGEPVIFDVKCSAHLARVIREAGGEPCMWKTGHSLIKAKLKETGAPLAGEMSGHIFFEERWYGFDDALYTGARLLEILARRAGSSAEVFAALPDAVSTPELRVNLEEGEPTPLMERLLAAGRERFTDATLHTIDGLRVEFPDGWGLIRSSNTTPSLVLRFEADDEAALERIKAAFRALLESIRPGLSLPF